MMSNSEEPAHGDPFERRLAAFDRHKDDLVAILQKVCERTAKPFDKSGAWRRIRFYARRYLKGEANAKEKQKMVSAADRSKSLRQLENTLRKARCKIDEAHIRHALFVEWCEAHGSPDFTDPIMSKFEAKFDKVVAGLADLETAAFRAAEQVRQKLGRPRGTGVLQQDFIIDLELAYRDITGKPGGGPGPFTKFIVRFFAALGSARAEDSVIKAIQVAKKRKEWGQSVLAGIGGKTPPN